MRFKPIGIFQCKPAIAVLNETWLKRYTLFQEILPESYKLLFREDRTMLTHSIDSSNNKNLGNVGVGL